MESLLKKKQNRNRNRRSIAAICKGVYRGRLVKNSLLTMLFNRQEGVMSDYHRKNPQSAKR